MQREMRDSSARLKAHCEQNLSSLISAIDIGHNNLHLFTRMSQVALPVSRGCCCSSGWNRAFKKNSPLWCFRAQTSLNIGTLESHVLDRWNLWLMLKISYADCPGLSLVTLAEFALEMCLAAQYRPKIHKPIKFQCSRLSKATALGANRKPT